MNVNHRNTLINPARQRALNGFQRDVLDGLRSSPKRLASKLFYDERGSQLFEAITQLAEYYLTRTEISIFREHLPEMAALIGPDALVIEFGTGAGVKTSMLLDALERPRAYVPIDISEEQLAASSRTLAERFPAIRIVPLHADYTHPITIPAITEVGKRVVFFPGSTIGNFEPADAVSFLKRAATLVGTGGGLLIGFDLRKDPATLEAAYNDSEGITAAFNLNMIDRIAAGFHAPISKQDFEHFAFFNEVESRIEMHLVSRRAQHVLLAGEEIYFAEGEHIITEYSYKYSPEAFGEILSASGFEIVKRWSDPKEYFEVCYAGVT